MDSILSPREIQSRVCGRATLTGVTTEAGVDPAQIKGFALPVLAEHERMTNTALDYVARRQGNGSEHRRLQELIFTRLQVRGIDSEDIAWDSRRGPDRKRRLARVLESHEWRTESIFDLRGRFTIANNPNTRRVTGEELPSSKDPDNESTVNFSDEFTLVRVTTQSTTSPPLPGDDVPTGSFDEGPATSEFDDLYDVLSGVSEGPVRIYVGIDDESSREETPQRQDGQEEFEETEVINDFTGVPEADAADTVETSLIEPVQDPLVETDTGDTASQPKSWYRRRARAPSWDGILFGGLSSR